MKRISLRTMVVLLVCLAIALVTTAGVLAAKTGVAATRPAATSLESLGAGLSTAGLASAAFSSAPAMVIGTVTHEVAYRERAFPMGRGTRNISQALTVQLVDTSVSSGPPVVLGQQIIYVAGGPPPYQFAIEYAVADLRPDGAYALTAEIAVDGAVLFSASTGPIALQTEAPIEVVLVLKAVDLQRSAGLPAGIERLARFSY